MPGVTRCFSGFAPFAKRLSEKDLGARSWAKKFRFGRSLRAPSTELGLGAQKTCTLQGFRGLDAAPGHLRVQRRGSGGRDAPRVTDPDTRIRRDRSTGRQDKRADERVSWPAAAKVGEGDLGVFPARGWCVPSGYGRRRRHPLAGCQQRQHSRAILWKMVTFTGRPPLATRGMPS